MSEKKNTSNMTAEEFERYLKRNKITGMAAVVAANNRRRQMNAVDLVRESREEWDR